MCSNCSLLLLLLVCNLWDKVCILFLSFFKTWRPLSQEEAKQFSYVKEAHLNLTNSSVTYISLYNLTLMHLWTRRWHVTIILIKSFFNYSCCFFVRNRSSEIWFLYEYKLDHRLRSTYRRLKRLIKFPLEWLHRNWNILIGLFSPTDVFQIDKICKSAYRAVGLLLFKVKEGLRIKRWLQRKYCKQCFFLRMMGWKWLPLSMLLSYPDIQIRSHFFSERPYQDFHQDCFKS